MDDRSRFRRAKIGVLTALIIWLGAPCSFGAWPPDPESSPEAALESLYGAVRRIAVHDPEPVRRAWAWRALGRAQDPRLIPLAAHGLQDPSPMVRVEVLARLRENFPNQESAWAEMVLAARFDPHPGVRVAAAGMFDLAPNHPGGCAALTLGLLDECETVRAYSQIELVEDDSDADWLDPAVWIAATTGSIEARVGALRCAARMNSEATPLVRELVACSATSPAWEVRFAAAATEATYDRSNALQRMLADPDPLVRLLMLHDLELEAYRDVDVLARLLLDDDPRVANAALNAVEIEDRCFQVDRAALRRRALDADPQRADVCLTIAWRAQARRAADEPNEVRRPLGDGLDDVFAAATEIGDAGLDRSDDEIDDALAKLEWLLGRPDPRVRRAACSASAEAARLVARRKRAATPAQTARLWARLWENLDDDDASVRRTAIMQIAKAYPEREGNPRLGKALDEVALRVFQSPDKELARAALLAYDAPVWPAEITAAMQSLAADETLSFTDRLDLFERRLKRAPDSVSTTELGEWLARPYNSHAMDLDQRIFPLLFARGAWDEVARRAAADSFTGSLVTSFKTGWLVSRRTFAAARLAGVDDATLAAFTAQLDPAAVEHCIGELSAADRLSFCRRSPYLLIAAVTPDRRLWTRKEADRFVEREAMRAAVDSGDPIAALAALTGMLMRPASDWRLDDPSPTWRTLEAIAETVRRVEKPVKAETTAL